MCRLTVTKLASNLPNHTSHFSLKMAALIGMSRKSQSTSQLTSSSKKQRASFQRSEEVGAAADLRMKLMPRQASKDSTDGSISSDSASQ